MDLHGKTVGCERTCSIVVKLMKRGTSSKTDDHSSCRLTDDFLTEDFLTVRVSLGQT